MISPPFLQTEFMSISGTPREPATLAHASELGGYEHEFVDSPHDRLVCKICIHPCRDPYLSGCCGHNFCKLCLDNAKAATKTCPFCRNKEFSTFPNRQADREIRSLHVMCTNKERGCEWQGELNYINNHLVNSDGCQFEDVKCSNGCGKMLQRRYLTSHVETECLCRKVDCSYCHITGEHQFIEGEHKEQCPKLPLPCPNKCEVGSVLREDMEAHRKECSLEMVQCEYHNVGCDERIIRKDLEKHEHERMKGHLSLTKVKLMATDQQLQLTTSQLTDTRSQLDGALEQINTLMILMHQTVMVQKHTSDPFRPVPNVLTAQWWARLTAKAIVIKSGDQVCPVIMNINFTELTRTAVYWFSDPFYSHDEGYKMCLRVNIPGHGKGTHLSVFLHLMKGPHDDELTWPMREKFEFKLLNQVSDCQHHSVTLIYGHNDGNDVTGRVTGRDRATAGAGYSQFILMKNLYKVSSTRHYVKDDSIFFQVSKL